MLAIKTFAQAKQTLLKLTNDKWYRFNVWLWHLRKLLPVSLGQIIPREMKMNRNLTRIRLFSRKWNFSFRNQIFDSGWQDLKAREVIFVPAWHSNDTKICHLVLSVWPGVARERDESVWESKVRELRRVSWSARQGTDKEADEVKSDRDRFVKHHTIKHLNINFKLCLLIYEPNNF